jgi:hypothetical protein
MLIQGLTLPWVLPLADDLGDHDCAVSCTAS